MSDHKLLSQQITDWVCSCLGSQHELRSIHKLQGSTSSDLFCIQTKTSSRITSYVLRLLTNREWLSTEPDLTKHEAEALRVAGQTGLTVPEVISIDPDGKSCGSPAVLMTRISGNINLLPQDFDSWLRQMAETLNEIHSQDALDFEWKYFSYNKPETLVVPAWTAQPGLWEKAIEIVNQPPPDSRYCFIHRDYHPMNTLWDGEMLCGIVDWVNACRGPAPFDLAWNRLNLMQMYNLKAADRLRDHAIEACGVEVWHPYWDLMALIELLPGPPKVYPPWLEFGLTSFSTRQLITRTEIYLESLLEHF